MADRARMGAEPIESESGAWPGGERRSARDRRGRPTRVWDSLRRGGRRRVGRRSGEDRNAYVDVYRRRDVLMLVAIFVLNLLDAMLTLQWLQMGGSERNPFMNWMIELGDGVFIAQKCFVVGVWLVLLTVHKNFRMARIGLWSLLFLYALVLVLHFALQAGRPGAPPAP